jgi:hypothetical protein
MKKLTNKELNQVEIALTNVFNSATNNEISRGLNWYSDANVICNNLAVKHNVDVYKVAGVISALSPRNKWDKNIKDAETVIRAHNMGLPPESVKVSTFHSNKFKAFNILKGNTTITDTSLKTFNFVNNIAYLDANSLTVDIWHLRGCFNKTIKIDNATIGRIAYGQIKDLTVNIANKLGLKGYQLQAIIWIAIQRQYNN